MEVLRLSLAESCDDAYLTVFTDGVVIGCMRQRVKAQPESCTVAVHPFRKRDHPQEKKISWIL